MAVILSDEEITHLLAEAKPLPDNFRVKIQVRPKRGHRESELDIKGDNGSDFRLIVRQSLINALDFSIILTYMPPKSNQLFRLRRYNGKSHEHTNSIEDRTFYDYHIHYATARYQEIGAREDSYAEATDRYADLQQAVTCMIQDCSFQLPPNPQGQLFEDA